MSGAKVLVCEDGTLIINGKIVGWFDTYLHDNGEGPIQLIIDGKTDDQPFAKVVF